MAGSPRYTYSADEVLTAASLNADMVQLATTNDQLVGTPRSAAFAMRSQQVQLDADDNTYIVSTADDRVDVACAGTVLFRFDGTSTTPANGIDFIAGDSGTDAVIKAGVGDATGNLDLQGNSTGSVGVRGVEISPLAFAFFS